MIVEIVGPAGAGKTTISRALCQHKRILASKRLKPGQPRHVPFMAYHYLRLLPTFLSRPRNGVWFTNEEIKKMVYLEKWHRVLKRQRSNNNAVIVIDQGPVFKLAALHGFGPPWLKDPNFEKWWQARFSQWGSVLDIIFYLNAPDAKLIERILDRDLKLKENSVAETRKFLSKYRASLEYVISRLTANHHLKVFEFDTSRASTEHIVREILVALDHPSFVHSKSSERS